MTKIAHTMKYLILLVTIAAMTGCKKDKTVLAKSTSANLYNPKWIPNWYSGDTLVGKYSDTMGNFAGYDTMYTLTIGDTSCIIYHGTKYYVWGSDYYNEITELVDSFGPAEKLYARSYMAVTPFDTLNCMDHGKMTSYFPHKYLQPDGITWQHQHQVVIVHSYLNFKPVFLNQYRSNRTY